MKTPICVLLAVAEIGGWLGVVGESSLRMLLPADCPQELKDAIRRHKVALLELLGFKFVIIRSNALNCTLIWTPDAETKALLITAGAEPSSIYTAAELEILVHRRITVAELRAIHAAKRKFSGTLGEP